MPVAARIVVGGPSDHRPEYEGVHRIVTGGFPVGAGTTLPAEVFLPLVIERLFTERLLVPFLLEILVQPGLVVRVRVAALVVRSIVPCSSYQASIVTL